MLVDGEWHTDVEGTTDDDGNYDRYVTEFRDGVRGRR
jgi:glutathionyl-hydroquinone reductase